MPENSGCKKGKEVKDSIVRSGLGKGDIIAENTQFENKHSQPSKERMENVLSEILSRRYDVKINVTLFEKDDPRVRAR